MLGLLYIGLCLVLGYLICRLVFPVLEGYLDNSLKGTQMNVSDAFIRLPAWFVAGTLVMTWFTYILACLFKNTFSPLLVANTVSMVAVTCVCIFIFWWLSGNETAEESTGGKLKKIFNNRIKTCEVITFTVIAVLFIFLIYQSFFIKDGELYVGLTVFSDFTPHLSMIRSFSFEQNFPTQYSVCAGADVRYHFMFQFLTGNLEFLGLRLDHAFNILSILSLMSMYSLLYSMAVKITGKRLTGILTTLLLTFRSSLALFYFLNDSSDGIWSALKNNLEFIGSTNNENWGLWNLNVYLNQRHLPLGLSVMLFILLLFLPYVYSGLGHGDSGHGYVITFAKESLIGREGWIFSDVRMSVGAGIVLGALGFFNGAVLIATVVILFFMAAVSDHRLDFLITAVIAGGLSLLQTKVFIDGETLSPSIRLGFLADKATFLGMVSYLVRLCGVLLIVLLIAFVLFDGVSRYLIFAFSVPLILSFIVSLTPDIAVNHKYIMISIMLLDIFAAEFITGLIAGARSTETRKGNKLLAVSAVFLIFCLTATGIYETVIIVRRNSPRNAIVNSADSQLTEWIHRHCTADDLFLTSNYYLMGRTTAGEIILSGASLYNAWEYFGWSAGYDTSARDAVTASVYGCSDRDTLIRLVEDNDFDYIVIDYFNRVSDYYVLNEELFDETFGVAYSSGSDDTLIKIYDTSVILN